MGGREPRRRDTMQTVRIYRRYVMLERNPALLRDLDRLGVPYEIDTRRYGEIESVTGELFVFEDDPAFAKKCAAIERHELFGQEGTLLSDVEHAEAEWHHLATQSSGYPQPERGWFTAMYGTEGVCARCGFHARAVAPVRLRRVPGVTQPRVFGVHWAFEVVLLTDAAKRALQRARVSGVRYRRPVLHGSGEPSRNVWQLEIETVLRPAMRTGDLVEERCEPIIDSAELRPLRAMGSSLVRGPYCGRTKWNHPTRGLLTIDLRALARAPDVVLTHEQLGSGASSNRLVLVRKRVRDLLRAAKIGGVSFHPIALA